MNSLDLEDHGELGSLLGLLQLLLRLAVLRPRVLGASVAWPSSSPSCRCEQQQQGGLLLLVPVLHGEPQITNTNSDGSVQHPLETTHHLVTELTTMSLQCQSDI